MRAWNDWHLEAWAGPYPDRIIPCQIPYLLDPELGAKMIRENAGAGFHLRHLPGVAGTPASPRCTPATGIPSWRRAPRPAR